MFHSAIEIKCRITYSFTICIYPVVPASSHVIVGHEQVSSNDAPLLSAPVENTPPATGEISYFFIRKFLHSGSC